MGNDIEPGIENPAIFIGYTIIYFSIIYIKYQS
jgi:hypothetical protein